MEITKENLVQAISALKQCAKEHSSDITDTFKIRVSDLCNDVAEYLEKTQSVSLNDIPSDEEIEQAMRTSVTESILCVAPHTTFTPQATDLLECAWLKGANWVKSKITKQRNK